MAELKTLCFGNNCMDNTEYTASNYLNLNGGAFSLKQEDANVSSTTKSIPNNSTSSYNVYTAPKTGWLVGRVTLSWATNASGRRGIDIYRGSTHIGGENSAAAPSGTTQSLLPFIFWVSAGNVVQFRFFQTSGGNLNVTYSMTAMLLEK